jgi:hypothetical protein
VETMKSIRFTLVVLLLAAFGPGNGLCSWSFAFGSVSFALTPGRKERSGGSAISGAPLQLLAGRSGRKFESIGAIAALDWRDVWPAGLPTLTTRE